MEVTDANPKVPKEALFKPPPAKKRKLDVMTKEEQEYSNQLLSVWIGSTTATVATVEEETFRAFIHSINPEVFIKFIVCKVIKH